MKETFGRDVIIAMPLVALLVMLLMCISGYAASADLGYLQMLVERAGDELHGMLLAIPEFRSRQSAQPERTFVFTIASQFLVPLISIAWAITLQNERKKVGAKNLGWPVRVILLYLTIAVILYYFYLVDGYAMVNEISSVVSLSIKDIFVSIMAPTFFVFFLPAKLTLRRN